jgi:hypothetical protein
MLQLDLSLKKYINILFFLKFLDLQKKSKSIYLIYFIYIQNSK